MKLPPTTRTRAPAMRRLAACLSTALIGSAASDVRSTPLPLRGRPATNTLFVSNCNDSGAGSLRDSLLLASDGDHIDLQRLVCSVITLETGSLESSLPSITLIGPGADRLSISGAGTLRVIDHTGTGMLTVQGLTVRGGSDTGDGGCIRSAGSVYLAQAAVIGCRIANSAFGRGGGIFAQGNFFMTESRLADNHVSNASGTSYGGGAFIHGDTWIRRSTVSGNSAEYTGGGLFLYHGVDIEHSTIAGNRVTGAAGQGGGLTMLNFPADARSLSYDTVSGNSATLLGGGIRAYGHFSMVASTIAANTAAHGGGLQIGGPTSVSLSIVFGNTSVAGSTDIAGNGTLAGVFDLVGTSVPALPDGTLRSDPLLAPLADNGGPTLTQALLPGSPAINAVGYTQVPLVAQRLPKHTLQPDAIDVTPFAAYDQRGDGATRRVGVGTDIGAYEVQTTGVTHTVSSCADSGDGSLRAVIDSSLSGDTIDLQSLSCSSITLTSGALIVDQGNLALIGPGAGHLTIDANRLDRAIYHRSLGTLTLSGLTIANGLFTYADGHARGGCVYSHSTLVLDGVTLASCEASGRQAYGGGADANRLLASSSSVHGNAAVVTPNPNTSGYGGGLFADHFLSLEDTTLSENLGTGTVIGIGAASFGDVVIAGSTISGNQASTGLVGSVFAAGELDITDSTISGNSALGSGGVFATSALFLSSSTVANNTTTTTTGIFATAGGLTAGTLAHLQSSIVFGNRTGTSAYDIGGTALVVGANNLVGNSHTVLPTDTVHDDPLLGPLAHNGGPTQTHALSPGSPAIDHGNNAGNLTDDQRGIGFVRVSGAAADIGAFETQPDADVIFRNGFD